MATIPASCQESVQIERWSPRHAAILDDVRTDGSGAGGKAAALSLLPRRVGAVPPPAPPATAAAAMTVMPPFSYGSANTRLTVIASLAVLSASVTFIIAPYVVDLQIRLGVDTAACAVRDAIVVAREPDCLPGRIGWVPSGGDDQAGVPAWGSSVGWRLHVGEIVSAAR